MRSSSTANPPSSTVPTIAPAESPDTVVSPVVMEAYQFEVYSDRLILRGVCSNAPLEEVVRWMNATSVFTWEPATGVLFRTEMIAWGARGEPLRWEPAEPWPVRCSEPDKAETHRHYLLRSGAR